MALSDKMIKKHYRYTEEVSGIFLDIDVKLFIKELKAMMIDEVKGIRLFNRDVKAEMQAKNIEFMIEGLDMLAGDKLV